MCVREDGQLLYADFEVTEIMWQLESASAAYEDDDLAAFRQKYSVKDLNTLRLACARAMARCIVASGAEMSIDHLQSDQ